MEQAVVYGAYFAAGVLALAVYLGLPKEGRPSRGGLALLISACALGGLVLLLGRLFGDRTAGRFYFYVLSVLAVAGGIRVITHPRPVYSALYFILVVLSTAALLVLAGAEFLAAALVIIYAGAILVTYVFVIMMARQSPLRRDRFVAVVDYDRTAREPAAAVLAGFVLLATLAGVIVARTGLSDRAAAVAAPAKLKTEIIVAAPPAAAESPATEGNTLQVARTLLLEDGFPVSLQVAGVLLTVAMIGAIAIVRKRLPRLEEEAEALPLGEIGKHVKPF